MMANTPAKKLTWDSNPVQVESAIRDGSGLEIATTYAKKTESSPPGIILTNTAIASADWVSNDDFAEYAYRANIANVSVTANMHASVVFSDEDAATGEYSPICQTHSGGVYVYSKENKAITIPTIIIDTFNSYVDLSQIYPVGSIYMNATNNANPSTLLGFGTWQELAPGRVLMGAGTGTDTNSTSQTFTAGTTTGEYTHTLGTTEMPSHGHSVSVNSTSTEHTHSGTTGNQNALHTHSGTTGNESVTHTHGPGSLGFKTKNIISIFNQDDGSVPYLSHITANLEYSGAKKKGSSWSGNDDTFRLNLGYDNADNVYRSGATDTQSANHTHSITTGTESAWHQHGFTTGNMSANASHGHTVNQSNAGGGGAHNNIQPSLVVYMWVRTA